MQSARPAPAAKFCRSNEFFIIVGAAWQHAQQVLGTNHRQQIGFGIAVMVDKNTWPPGLTRRAQAAMTEAGSGTCSSISRQVTVSKVPGISSASCSAVVWR